MNTNQAVANIDKKISLLKHEREQLKENDTVLDTTQSNLSALIDDLIAELRTKEKALKAVVALKEVSR